MDYLNFSIDIHVLQRMNWNNADPLTKIIPISLGCTLC